MIFCTKHISISTSKMRSLNIKLKMNDEFKKLKKLTSRVKLTHFSNRARFRVISIYRLKLRIHFWMTRSTIDEIDVKKHSTSRVYNFTFHESSFLLIFCLMRFNDFLIWNLYSIRLWRLKNNNIRYDLMLFNFDCSNSFNEKRIFQINAWKTN